MNHHIKRILFKSYAVISITVFITVILVFICGFLSWEKFAGIAAGVLAFAFGIQKQNLREIKLFKELFEQFNDRYDEMNDYLNQIYQQSPDKPLDENEIKTLFKYFNLCGEEWLYAKRGFICEEVWKAWKSGMAYFRRNSRIKDFWDKELNDNDSYYGMEF